jgi:hypothetical protein
VPWPVLGQRPWTLRTQQKLDAYRARAPDAYHNAMRNLRVYYSLE